MECNSMKYLVWKSYLRGKLNNVHNENILSLWKFSNLCCPVTADVINHASSHNARFIWMWSYEYSYWYVCLVSNDSLGQSRPDGSFPGCILLISNMECIWWREFTWWCHDMEMFSKLLALCEGFHWSSVHSLHKRPVMQSCCIWPSWVENSTRPNQSGNQWR